MPGAITDSGVLNLASSPVFPLKTIQRNKIDKVSNPVSIPVPAESMDTDEKILQLLRSYSPPGELKNTISRPVVEDSIRRAIASGDVLHFVLPAFPFKSPNNIDKVLGTLPDLAEEIALARLEGLCADIERRLQRTTTLSIVSDGIVYNGMHS